LKIFLITGVSPESFLPPYTHRLVGLFLAEMGIFNSGACGLRLGLLLALMRVKLPLNRRLRVPVAGISRELSVALFADPEHRNVPHSLHDPKIALCHETVSHSHSNLASPSKFDPCCVRLLYRGHPASHSLTG
jgi:hypothetical protein